MEPGDEVVVYPVWNNQGNDARKAYNIGCFSRQIKNPKASKAICFRRI